MWHWQFGLEQPITFNVLLVFMFNWKFFVLIVPAFYCCQSAWPRIHCCPLLVKGKCSLTDVSKVNSSWMGLVFCCCSQLERSADEKLCNLRQLENLSRACVLYSLNSCLETSELFVLNFWFPWVLLFCIHITLPKERFSSESIIGELGLRCCVLDPCGYFVFVVVWICLL